MTADDEALVIALSPTEVADVMDLLDTALRYHDLVTVWIDPLDQAFKVKLADRTWSPPIGQRA